MEQVMNVIELRLPILTSEATGEGCSMGRESRSVSGWQDYSLELTLHALQIAKRRAQEAGCLETFRRICGAIESAEGIQAQMRLYAIESEE
jgi:hypothetical protein